MESSLHVQRAYPVRNDVLRFDYNPLPSLTVSYRLMRNTQETRIPWGAWTISNNFALTPIHGYQPGLSHVLQATKIFSPTLVNEARFAYTLNNIHSDYADPSKVARSALGSPAQLYTDAGSPDTAPDINFGSQPANTVRLGLGPGDWYWRGTEFTYADNISKVFSKHTLKAGFNLDYYRAVAMDTRGTWRGSYNFGRDTNNPFDTNNGFTNALLGTFSSYSELTSRALKNTVLKVFEEYVQDNWRVSKRLTLDFGLRCGNATSGIRLGQQRRVISIRPFTTRRRHPYSTFRRSMPAAGASAMDPTTKTAVPAALIGLFVPNTGDPGNGSRVGGLNGYPGGLFHPVEDLLRASLRLRLRRVRQRQDGPARRLRHLLRHADANSFESSAGNPPISYTPVQYYGNLSTDWQQHGTDRAEFDVEPGCHRPRAAADGHELQFRHTAPGAAQHHFRSVLRGQPGQAYVDDARNQPHSHVRPFRR